MNCRINVETMPELIARAAALLRQGGVVAFPTETVYGLGANALDPTAIARIYEIKQRPRSSPLIVHVSSIAMARDLVTDWPDKAEILSRHFWPGPLTLVLPKSARVPPELTAGLETVGLRMPAHPIALALIEQAGVPIAAPSANRFTHLSPTSAQHVENGLGAAVDLIIAGGPAQVGIESTVLSLAQELPLLLRPGMITRTEIEKCIGPIGMSDTALDAVAGAHPSPGMHEKHYAPRTPLYVVRGSEGLPPSGRGAYLFLTAPGDAKYTVAMPHDPGDYARVLYDTLHRQDQEGWDWLAVEQAPESAEWAGIVDRLKRAAIR